MAKVKKPRVKYFTDEPMWDSIRPAMRPITVKGIERNYSYLLHSAAQWVHTEVDSAEVARAFISYADKFKVKNHKTLLKRIPDHEYYTLGKYAYIHLKGAVLPDAYYKQLDAAFVALYARAETAKQTTEESSVVESTRAVPTIQSRMRDKVGELCGDWEGKLDELVAGTFDIDKFDPYSDMKSQESEIKPNHARIILDLYRTDVAEADAVLLNKDEDVKEAYSHLTAKQRKQFRAFYQKIQDACNTIIGTGRAERKPRVKKAPSKERQVARLKYQVNDPQLAASSINPVSIIGAEQLWIYNTKSRKLGVFIADPMIKALGVKGSTITGYDSSASTWRTVRKPEIILKGVQRLPRTKLTKLYNDLTTTSTSLRPRISADTILLRVF
jgi:hypothetical protein